jgi:hypothetical protein
MGLAFGLIWGGAMLVIGIANLMWPGYGIVFLDLMGSLYPGYSPGGFGSVIVGTLYALVDGFIGGMILAWLYNMFAAKSAPA